MTGPNESDTDPQARWIEQAKAGDLDAQGVLLLACHADLLRHIEPKMPRRLKTLHNPEDFLHDTFNKAIAGLDRFEYRGKGSFLAWLKQIATRTLIDANRKKDVNTPSVRQWNPPGQASSCFDVIKELPGSSKGASTKFAEAEMLRAFHVALAKLPPDQQEAIRLRYLQDLPIEKVAGKLGKTEASVRGLCHRARKALQEHMEGLSRFI